MSRLEIRPFESADISEAGVLLAERHRVHRQTQPLLPGRFEGAEAAAAEVSKAFTTANASGAAALRGGPLPAARAPSSPGSSHTPIASRYPPADNEMDGDKGQHPIRILIADDDPLVRAGLG